MAPKVSRWRIEVVETARLTPEESAQITAWIDKQKADPSATIFYPHYEVKHGSR